MLFLNYLLLADEHLHHYHKFDQEYTPIPSVFEYHGFGNFMAKMMMMQSSIWILWLSIKRYIYRPFNTFNTYFLIVIILPFIIT